MPGGTNRDDEHAHDEHDRDGGEQSESTAAPRRAVSRGTVPRRPVSRSAVSRRAMAFTCQIRANCLGPGCRQDRRRHIGWLADLRNNAWRVGLWRNLLDGIRPLDVPVTHQERRTAGREVSRFVPPVWVRVPTLQFLSHPVSSPDCPH